MTNVSTTGTVMGTSYIGGLAGDIQGGSITGATVSGTDLAASSTLSGGLVGRSTVASLNINNVTVSKNLTGGTNYKGGLIGQITGGASGTINEAIMTGNITSATYAGGLVGYSNSDIALTVTKSYMSGDISTAAGTYNGGLIGYSYNDTLENVFSLANLTGTGDNNGGLIGYARGVTMTNAYTAGKVENTATASRQATIGAQAGTNTFAGIYWNVESSNIFEDTVGKPIATLYTPATDYVGFDFGSVWDMVQDPTAPQYTLPYLQDLVVPTKANITPWVDYTYAGKGLLDDPYLVYTNDDLNNIRNNPHAYYRVENELNLTSNWTPIPKVYAGGIDGQYYGLNGLTVTSNAVNGGFIANSAGDYTIHDWQVNGMTLTGNAAQKGFIGTATAGTLTVNNVDFNGGSIVPTSATATYAYNGAVLGWGNGASISMSDIDIDNNFSVKGAANTGGLAGNITGASSLDISYITVYGSVTAASGTTGGIFGTLSGDGNLEHIMFNGTFTAAGSNIGGIIGVAGGDLSIYDIIYNSNDIAGAANLGGLIGSSSAVLDIDTGNVTVSISGTTANTYAGGIIGQSSASTTIKNIGVDSGTLTGIRSTGGAVGYQHDGDLTLDNVHSSLDIGSSTTTYYQGGLVGYFNGAYSLSINNSSSSGNVTGTYDLGGLVGYANATGGSFTTITNSHATGNIGTATAPASTTGVGGLVGLMAGGRIEESDATGNVVGTTTVGGLIGSSTTNATTLQKTHATGSVTSTGTSGGLAGSITVAGSTVEDSYATGDVTSTGTINGGLIGSMTGGNISNSHATGDVIGTQLIGGLVGDMATSANTASSSVSFSYASGDVTGSLNYVAGLMGRNYATLSKVYASGNVTNSNTATTATTLYTASLVGYHHTSPISDTFAIGNVSTPTGVAHTYIGGLIGRTNATSFNNIYYGGILNGTVGTPTTRQILIGSGATLAAVQNAYWYSDISGYSGGVACGTNIPCATAVTQASTMAEFIGFDFTNVWDMKTDGNGSMPYLRGLDIDNKVYF
jgi:hypothetical protein